MKAKKIHKYLGIPLCFLLFLAALSGIILNHRDLLQSIDIPRAVLPSDYKFEKWNNGAVRGVLRADSLAYIYGGVGVWVTDSSLRREARPLHAGFVRGGDEAKIMSMARDTTGGIWVASQYRLYRLAPQRDRWIEQPLPSTVRGRLADLQITGDSVLLLSRSLLYRRSLSDPSWTTYELKKPDGYTGKILLFQILWMLHSGEYFGLTGRIIVDIIGLFVILLSITGIFYTIFSHRLMAKKNKHGTKEATEKKRQLSRKLSIHFKWHKVIGLHLYYILLFVFITGWVLRPPLMIPFILTKARPNTFSTLYSDNPWFDRLRGIREDHKNGGWLLSTSEGFFTLQDFSAKPEKWELQPEVSPMGVNGFAQRPDGSWLIGSFAGLFEVYPGEKDPIRNYFTGEVIREVKMGPPISDYLVSGLLAGDTPSEDYIFLHYRGAVRRASAHKTGAQDLPLVHQPEALNEMPYSLWQAALELHAGRLYRPFLGKWGTDLFIFFLGLASVIVLITGQRNRRKKKKQAKHDR
jgi:hypothetical protein